MGYARIHDAAKDTTGVSLWRIGGNNEAICGYRFRKVRVERR